MKNIERNPTIPGAEKLVKRANESSEKRDDALSGLEFEKAFEKGGEVISPETENVLCLRDLSLYLASGRIGVFSLFRKQKYEQK